MYMNTIDAIAALFMDSDSSADKADLTVRKIAIYNMETCCSAIPDKRDRLRPKWSIKKTAQRRDAMNLTAPKTAVTNNFSGCPPIPKSENNSGAYAVLW